MKRKIYGKAKNEFLLVVEDDLKGVWDLNVDVSNEVDFIAQSGKKSLSENEIFFINIQNSDIKNYLDSIKNSSSCNNIEDKLYNLETLYTYKQENKIELYIQRILPSSKIKKTLLSVINNLPRIQRDAKSITIQNHTHIYWSEARERIYFYKFSDLESVFPNLARYYREASKKELADFADSKKYPFLDVRLNMDKLSKTTLRSIAIILDELKEFNGDINDYIDYAKIYTKDFVKNNKFEINKEKEDIENLSSVILRKFYTTEIGEKEKREAISYKSIKKDS